jgi:hypothetical protein
MQSSPKRRKGLRTQKGCNLTLTSGSPQSKGEHNAGDGGVPHKEAETIPPPLATTATSSPSHSLWNPLFDHVRINIYEQKYIGSHTNYNEVGMRNTPSVSFYKRHLIF